MPFRPLRGPHPSQQPRTTIYVGDIHALDVREQEILELELIVYGGIVEVIDLRGMRARITPKTTNQEK